MRISDWSSDVCSSDLAADLGRFLVGKAARADEDQRLSLAFRKFQKATLDVGQLKAVVLPRRGRQHPVHRFLIYLPAKARAPQDGEMAVSEDHERPGFHACAGRIDRTSTRVKSSRQCESR